MKFRGEKLSSEDAQAIVDELTIAKQYSPEYVKTVKAALNSNHKRRKYTLEELTEQCTPENSHEEIDWGAPVGKELI